GDSRRTFHLCLIEKAPGYHRSIKQLWILWPCAEGANRVLFAIGNDLLGAKIKLWHDEHGFRHTIRIGNCLNVCIGHGLWTTKIINIAEDVDKICANALELATNKALNRLPYRDQNNDSRHANRNAEHGQDRTQLVGAQTDQRHPHVLKHLLEPQRLNRPQTGG